MQQIRAAFLSCGVKVGKLVPGELLDFFWERAHIGAKLFLKEQSYLFLYDIV